jgi:acyl transferase domain-containing protein/enoyl-CoA hydratase/carnithine racemase/acyl carrier protein/NAD(P)-dependent dehydrogenase (short-subunit alcohol dehydrogenase family)
VLAKQQGLCNSNKMFIPFIIQHIEFNNKLQDQCYVIINNEQVILKQDNLSTTLEIYDKDGKLLGSIELIYKNVDKDFIYKQSNKALLYAPSWIEDKGEKRTEESNSRGLIIFGNNNDEIDNWIRTFKDKYDAYYFIQKGLTYEVLSDYKYQVRLNEEHDFIKVFQLISTQQSYTGIDILYNWSNDKSEIIDSYIVEDNIQGFFHMIKGCIANKVIDNTHILALTTNTQKIHPTDKVDGYQYSGLVGLAKSIRQEHTRLKIKLVDMELQPLDFSNRALIKDEFSNSFIHTSIGYRQGKRYIESIKPILIDEESNINYLRENGVYVVVGGTKGIGNKIARMFVGQKNVKVIAIGRSYSIIQQDNNLEGIDYFACNIANSKQVNNTMKLIKEKYGAIHGIINCAGVLEDKLFIKKNWDSFTKVLAPKVKGTLNLHKYSLDQPLDFFVVTSSVVSIIGNMGQGDYATGNSFLDSFINYRQSQGFSGLSLSLNYTLWSDGGMGNTKEHIERFQEKAGVINSQSGLQAMNQCIIGKVPRVIVAGNRQIEKYFSNNQPDLDREEIKAIQKATPSQVKENIIASLGKILGLSQEDIDDEADLRELGMESVSLIEFGEDLSRLFNLDIDATLLFEYTSVTQIVDYIISKSDMTKIDDSSQIAIKETKEEQVTINEKIVEASTEDIQVEKPINKNINNGDIAVIGMSGQFPMSKDIREFWNHLVNQDDLIKEVPKDRWDYEALFGNPLGEENKSNSNWGGFLDDIRGFDASFFGISPREAELMDPQQRLLLQEVWHTLEDSGYTPSQIQGSKTGVYVGVCNNDYDELVIKHGKRFDAYSSTGLYFSIIANRISYLLDLHGPSVSMDTACSSSLVALHQAILAINNGDCDKAFVGGVNIMATPRRYISFSNGGMLSNQGRCKTFDESADGYVRSEGVGVILVKPLEKAIEDNDNIYGVIKSTMVNHGGFSNSLTAPNPNAQGELLKEAYLRAEIHPDTITYMEAHGTGTSLGDPIEINGIKKAFQDLYKSYHMDMPIDNRCAIGAVKTNVGHMESASGIAGIIKVLLSMKHKTICGNIHMNSQNSKIKLEDTPFYFPRQTQEWKTVRNSENKIVPRRAGISSFGFGGVNAHVVLEEWQGNEKQHRDYEKTDKHLIILSAKNKERLKIYANNIANYLKDSKNKEDKLYSKVLYDEIVSIVASILSIEHSEVIDAISLSELGFDPINFGIFLDKINEKYNMNITALSNNQMNIDELVNIIDKHISSKSNSEDKYMWNYDLSVEKIAYTLQIGREALEERIAFEVSNIDEIISKCEAYGLGYHKEGIYEGFVKKRGRGYIPQKDKINIEGLSNKEIGKLWLQGKIIPWSDLYINIPQKCHLPGYPFANDSYWIVEQEESNIQQYDTTQEVYYYKYNWYEENIELVSKDKYQHINQLAIIYDEESTYNQLVNKIRKNNNNITITPIKIDWEKQDIIDKDILDTLWKKNNKVSNCHILVMISRYDEELSQIVMEKGTYMFRNIFNSIENATYKGKWLMTACVRDNIPFAISLDSLCKSVHNFWQSFPFKIATFTGNVSQQFFIENVYEEIKYQEDNKFIMYKDHKRLVKGIQPLHIDKNIVNYQEGMTYIITGGMGAIGKTVALHLASKCKGKLILVGRSPLNKNKEEVLRKITSLGSEAIYIQGDIAIEEDVKRIIYEGKKRFGSIHCVINTAGVIDSTEFIGKSNSSIKNTLLPKVQGTLLLDKYTREEPIERFIMFSSISSVLGDFGQGDYAMANGFLDGYAAVREQHVQDNKARGYTQVINWPLWKDGGMHFDKSTEALYLQSSGMDYLTNQSGMKAFDNILMTNEKQAMCFVGNQNKINQFLCPNKEKKTKNNNGECTMKEVQEKSKKKIIIDNEKIVNDLVNIVSHILKLDKERIDVNENFGNYGFDSIMLKHFANNIGEQYNIQILPTIFFMHTTIEALSEYLYIEQKEAMIDFYIQEECKEESSSNSYEEDTEGIAIIGIASKFPRANNPHTFYNNLVDDIDCIKEIPRDRWNYEDYYGDINSSKQITNSKWCGFIDDVDKFDAPFFKILPSEAVLIDPQQRLLLQSVWEVIEDAGYTMSSLSDKSVGVFIGAQFADYQEIVTEHGSLSGHATLGNALAMLANRISYQFNFTGPSETIETACSSSLVALNRGIQSLKLGESKVAVVGGVNLALTPTSFIKAAQLGVMSPSGRCRTFDESADGYVKGEGVATVLLKPLSQAIKDKDNIYGIIKGAGVNHGGTANSITSPNSDAQAKLIYKVYQEANISPATISFVETHGTGTELGDPVEIEGLQKAFTKLYNYFGEDVNKSQYCGLGAVKTNIGHLEPAAGIAGLIKVLMSMKYKKLPKNQNFNKQNPYVKLDNTPFYLANETKEWQHMLDEDGKIIPRRAGVSSFGFGGVNAHVILEEYAEHNILEDNSQPHLFVLSARNDEVLINYAKSFINYIEDDKMPKALSSHIAYTLQVGREAMIVRLAIVAQDIYDWSKKLQQYINGNTSIDGLFLGTGKSTNSIIDEEVSRLIHERDLIELGSLWASGQDIPWKKLYQANQLQKVSLPTYPFERKRYWLDNIKHNKEQSKKIERKESNKCDEPTLVNSWIEKAKDYNGDEVQLDIIENSIAIIRMQDRKNKNMFSENLVKAILKTFENVKANENIKAIVVTGYENIFCMGATQGSLENISSMKEKCSDASFVYNTIAKCPVPVISAMQGYAFGGGLIFGLFADVIVGTLEGGYSANFTQYGFTPGVGSTYILKEKLGTSLANEMMYTADVFTGEELQRRGANIRFAKGDKVLQEAINIARVMVKKPTTTIKVLKQELGSRVLDVLPQYIESEVRMHEETFNNIDVNHLIKKFFRKENTEENIKEHRDLKVNNVEHKKSRAITLNNTKKKIKDTELRSKITLKPTINPLSNQHINEQENIKDNITTLHNKETSNKLYNDIVNDIKQSVCKLVQISDNTIDEKDIFKELGVDSISGIELIRALNHKYNTSLSTIALYSYPTISELASHLVNELSNSSKNEEKKVELAKEGTRLQSFAGARIDLVHNNNKNSVINQKQKVSEKSEHTIQYMEKHIATIVGKIVDKKPKEINKSLAFRDMGIDSISGIEIIRDINRELGISMDTITLYNYSTITKLVEHIVKNYPQINIRDTDNNTKLINTQDNIIHNDEDSSLDELLFKLYNQEVSIDDVTEVWGD